MKGALWVSHPLRYSVFMNRKTRTALTSSSQTHPVNTSTIASGQVFDPRNGGEKKSESGLLGLCHEIAGLLLRRYAENSDASVVRGEVKGELMRMMVCNAERADHLLELALELIHVKAKGKYKRNALELSFLIARAGDQVRNVGDN